MDRKYWIYLKDLFLQNWLLVAAWIGSGLLFGLLLFAYQYSFEPVILYWILTSILMLIYLGFYLRRLHTIKHLLNADSFDPKEYPQDLKRCAAKMEELARHTQQLETDLIKENTQMQDYFSLWAHQIKLPLSVISLQLDLPEPNLEAIRQSEKRIDESVRMVMAYVRLSGSDYRIVQTALEHVVRQVLRDNSSNFIGRHIRLETDFEGDPVQTDRKWIAFVIEQLLSNALKYSPDGSMIRIATRDNTLIIEDEGVGIAAEDLPRIFEKGFTGRNGHENTSASSGLGLYLCKRICDNLGCQLILTNRDQGGVQARIIFPDTPYIYE